MYQACRWMSLFLLMFGCTRQERGKTARARGQRAPAVDAATPLGEAARYAREHGLYLPDLLDRVRALAAGSAWRQPGFHDRELDRLLGVLQARFQLTEPLPSSLVVQRGDLEIAFPVQQMILVDGNFSGAGSDGAVIIATGHVSLSHSHRSLVIAGGDIDMASDNAIDDELAQHRPSLLLAAGAIDLSWANGTTMGAGNGLDFGVSGAPAQLVVSPRTRHFAADPDLTIEAPEIALIDEVPSPLEASAKAAQAGEAEVPALALYLGGSRVVLRQGDQVTSGAAAGYRLLYASSRGFVLARGRERMRLAATLPPEPAPPDAQLPRPPAGAKLHVIAVYEADTPGRRIVVDVDTQGPSVLALLAHDSVSWVVRLGPGAQLAGVVLAGTHVSRLVDPPAQVPVIVRFDDFGQVFSDDDRAAESLLALTGLALASFRHEYGGKTFTVR